MIVCRCEQVSFWQCCGVWFPPNIVDLHVCTSVQLNQRSRTNVPCNALLGFSFTVSFWSHIIPYTFAFTHFFLARLRFGYIEEPSV